MEQIWVDPVTSKVSKKNVKGHIHYITFEEYEGLQKTCNKMKNALLAVKNALNEGGSLADLVEKLEEALIAALRHQ